MSGHIPVLLDEVVAALAPRDGGLYVDGTFGGGGYARALLSAAACTVAGIDRDPDAIARGRALAADNGGRLILLQGAFSEMEALLAEAGLAQAQGVTLDLGVSSFQLDEAERGFSFAKDGPLDMRMSGAGPSAADVVNTYEEAALRRIIAVYGEERRAGAVARAIVRARTAAPILRTAALAEIVARAAGGHAQAIHPATRTFQALRIHVNDELGELARGLAAAERVLAPEGRLAVVSFHSLEDRIVKRFIAARAGKAPGRSRHLPAAGEGPAPSFADLTPGGATPSEAEIARNPRARSARLRAAQRTAAAPFPSPVEGLALEDFA